MLTALIFGSVVAGTGWCWVKLIAPWVRTHEFHEEVLEIQRELALPTGQPWSPEVDCTQDLANLAAAISVRSGIANSGEADTVAALNDGGKQRQQSQK
jgi:hypothetical protein